jgi:hypothetical protein
MIAVSTCHVNLQRSLRIGNLCLWVYFWMSFLDVAYPFRPNPLGHPAGTGITFFGRSIAVVESPSRYRFIRIVFWINLPAVASVFPLAHRLFSYQGFWLGLSEDAWLLLLVMVISFLQWYAIGRLLHGLRKRIESAVTVCRLWQRRYARSVYRVR